MNRGEKFDGLHFNNHLIFHDQPGPETGVDAGPESLITEVAEATESALSVRSRGLPTKIRSLLSSRLCQAGETPTWIRGARRSGVSPA